MTVLGRLRPIVPSRLRSCLKTVSSASNAGLVPDVGARILELKLPLLSSAHTPYESAPGNLQQRSYPVAVCSPAMGTYPPNWPATTGAPLYCSSGPDDPPTG